MRIITINKDFRHQWQAVYSGGGCSPALNARDYKDAIKTAVPIEIVGTLDSARHSQMDVMGGDGVSATLDTMHEPKKVCIPVITPDRANKRQHGRRFKDDDDDAFTLTGQDRHGVAVGVDVAENEEHPGVYVRLSDDCIVYCVWYEKYGCYIAIRKLTPKECFRLQGWDDEYFERAQMVNSDSQLYKQAGNGVTVNVVYEIAKCIPLKEGDT